MNNDNLYNTEDLMFASYKYGYQITGIDREVVIIGDRMGVLTPLENNSYYDIITGNVVEEERILSSKEFISKESGLSSDSILRIFETIEDVYDYVATEEIVENKTLCEGIPTSISFKASMNNYGFKEIYENELAVFSENKENKGFSSKIKKIGSIFKK